MVTLKKPQPKVSSGNNTKPAPKGAGKPAAKAAAPKAPKKGGVEYALNEIVTFKDYAEEIADDERVFEPGADVMIKGIEDRDGQKIYVLIAPEDSEAYDTDPDSINGMEASASEIKKKKKAGAVAKVKEAPKPEEVNLIGELAKMVKKAGDDQIGLARTIFEEAKQKFFYFGGIMANIYNQNLHAPDGITWIAGTKEAREAWETFCEDNFGLKSAQVRAYIDIYQTLSKLPNIDLKKIGEIGWSKMAEVSRYITSENAEELIEKAEALPITELKSTLKTEYVDADGKTPSGRTTRGAGKMSRVTFSFQLFEDQAATVKFIFEQAGKMLGLQTDAEVFEHIVNEWGADKLDPAKMKKAAAAGAAVAKTAAKAGVVKPTAKAKAAA